MMYIYFGNSGCMGWSYRWKGQKGCFANCIEKSCQCKPTHSDQISDVLFNPPACFSLHLFCWLWTHNTTFKYPNQNFC